MTSVSWFCSEHLLPLVNKFHFGINYRSLDVCAFDNAISHSESILNQLGGTIPNTGSIVDALNLLINGIPINKLARSYFQSLTGNIFHLTNFRIEFIGCVAMTNLGVENCEIDEDLFNKFEQFQILVARFSDSINDYIGTNRKINYAIPPIRPKQIVAYDTTLRDLSSEYFTSIKRYYSQQPDLDWNGAAEFAHRSPTARLAKAARRLETGFQYARFHAAGNAYGRSPQAVCDAIEVSIESIECLPIGRVQRCSTLHREFGLRADLQEVRAASAGDEFNFLARVLQAHMVRRLRARQALAKQQTKYVPAIFLGQNFSNAKLHDHP